jgi:uncharacterized Zn-finger protein
LSRRNGYHRTGGAVNRSRPHDIFPDWLMTAFEIIEIDEMVAACNGGGGPMGHPRVYLNLMPAGRVECPYCSRLFVNRGMAGRVPPEIGVVMPSARQAGEERPEESPAPRQTGAA